LLCVVRSAAKSADVPGFDQIAVVDIESGAAERFSYGDGWLVEEHLLISAPGEVAPRWVAGTALDTRGENTVLSIFDATHISDGPIAQARLPYSLPLGLHGTFRSEFPGG
jgi:all-trans-8'-apo-beta-carotenal 15,15'-oxygenase